MAIPINRGIKIVLTTEKLIKDCTSLSITKSEINWNKTKPILARWDNGNGPGRSIIAKKPTEPKNRDFKYTISFFAPIRVNVKTELTREKIKYTTSSWKIIMDSMNSFPKKRGSNYLLDIKAIIPR